MASGKQNRPRSLDKKKRQKPSESSTGATKELNPKVAAYEKKIEGLCPLIEEMGMLEDWGDRGHRGRNDRCARHRHSATTLPNDCGNKRPSTPTLPHFVRSLPLRKLLEEAPAEEAPAEEAPAEEAPAEEAQLRLL